MTVKFYPRCKTDVIWQVDSIAGGETRLEGLKRNVDEAMRSISRVFEAINMEQALVESSRFNTSGLFTSRLCYTQLLEVQSKRVPFRFNPSDLF